MSRYSCKKASEMVEKRRLFGLSFLEHLKLKWHLTACKACKSYEKQSELLDQALSNEHNTNIVNLSTEKKQEIIQSLKSE